jgi:hypothetical protein
MSELSQQLGARNGLAVGQQLRHGAERDLRR